MRHLPITTRPPLHGVNPSLATASYQKGGPLYIISNQRRTYSHVGSSGLVYTFNHCPTEEEIEYLDDYHSNNASFIVNFLQQHHHQHFRHRYIGTLAQILREDQTQQRQAAARLKKLRDTTN